MKNEIIIPYLSSNLPVIVENADEKTVFCFLEFFTAQIRNPNTRAAYRQAVVQFLRWVEEIGITELEQIHALVVATYIEKLLREKSKPTVNQHLAAIRSLFSWLVVRGVLEENPAATVKGPKHNVKKGSTPILTAEETKILLESIDDTHVVGLRDRALIAVMAYSFARISAVLNMSVGDYFARGKRYWFRLQEKGGIQYDVPAHHKAEEYLDAYLEKARSQESLDFGNHTPLFRSTRGQSRLLTTRRLTRGNAYDMIQRRRIEADIMTPIGNHSFRATGITTYLERGGTIDKAQKIAAHANIRTTQLYDRTSDAITLDEIERIQY